MLNAAVDGRLLAYTSGGISQYTRQLVSRTVQLLEHDERLTLLRSGRRPTAPIDAPGLRYASVLTPPHHRLEHLALPVELMRIRPRVVHSPDFIPPMHGPWRRVITIHDLAFLLYPETVTPENLAYYRQVSKAVKIADAIIAVSQHTADDIARLLDVSSERVRVIPNGVDPTLAPVTDRAMLNQWRTKHRIDRPYLLYGGTFEPRKNLPLLLEAFARLRRDCDVLLVLLGARGWLYEPTFQRIESLALSDHVRVLEHQPREEWAIAYSGAAVAVTPSLYEGFGLPVLEAMACGAPVVSSNASSLPEVVGDAGKLFDSGSVEDLEDVLRAVLGDHQLADQMRLAGFARVKGYSWDQAAASTLAIYRELAA